MNSLQFFTAEEIKQLRKPVTVPRKGPQGWSKSQVEPMRVLKRFSTLRLKKGFVLRAYQFRSGENGNAVVWAMPEESPFPSPECCPKLKDRFLKPPRPPSALDNLMEAIEGDDSHWSYLSASIFIREMSEFGALWHGAGWSTHEILDKAPSHHGDRPQGDFDGYIPHTKVDEWTWLKKEPKEWQPAVRKNNDKITVTFYSFSGLGQEAIYRDVDTFQAGKYPFKTKQLIIAKGGGGYVF